MKNVSCFFVLLLIFSCKSSNEILKESWMPKNLNGLPQILLTNNFQFKSRPLGLGASSFLIVENRDTFLCTAKHLLGKDMGIIPEVKTDSVNNLLLNWKAYPRNDKLSSDTIYAKNILVSNNHHEDIMLLEVEPTNSSIQPLRPRYSKVENGEELYLIGCMYSDYDCHQKVYKAKMLTYSNNNLILSSNGTFEVSGFSGAPVIDQNGFVVGLLYSYRPAGETITLYLEPINSIRKLLELEPN